MDHQQTIDIRKIYESISTTHNIQCSKCGKDNFKYDIGGQDAAKRFYNSGWRVKDETTYCPDCAKNITNDLKD
jgi:hypothetical protein